MSSLPTVLIFTYPEHGQANVNLATSYELALAGVNVHIASFAPLRTRVLRLEELIARRASRLHSSTHAEPAGSINFCECKGFTPWQDALGKHGVTIPDLRHPGGVSGALEMYSKFDIISFPWDREEYPAAIESCKEIITTVRPDVVVVDVLFYPAKDACELLEQNFMIMVPISIIAIILRIQSYPLLRYPISSSGFPYPLEWWHVPLNIYLSMRLVYWAMTSAKMRQIQALRQSLGIKSRAGVIYDERTKYICSALPEIDFPFDIIPDGVQLCGPIVMPFDPLEESDPVLKTWLDNGPTVLINLGSHVVADEKIAREIGGAIRILLDHHDTKGTSGKMQVIWKVKAGGDIDTAVDETIGKEVKDGRVKVLAWLDAEPVSILQHPNVVCTVHHGGANSYYEGVWSGIPHIVLPVWVDTYHSAALVEFLNIGVFGSKSYAPDVEAVEFGKALVKVTGDHQEAVLFRTSAKRLKEVCRTKGNGRELASLAILKEIHSRENGR